jgi:hypothetical protein
VYMNWTRCKILPAMLKKRSVDIGWLDELMKSVDQIEAGGSFHWKKEKRVFVQQMLQLILDTNEDQYSNFLGDYFVKLARKCQLTKGLFLDSYYDFMKRGVRGITYDVELAHFKQCGVPDATESRYPSQDELLDELRATRKIGDTTPVARAQVNLPAAFAESKSKTLLNVFGGQKGVNNQTKVMERFDMFATLMETTISLRRNVSLANALHIVHEMLSECTRQYSSNDDKSSYALVLHVLMKTKYAPEMQDSWGAELSAETVNSVIEMDGDLAKLPKTEADGVTSLSILTHLVSQANNCNTRGGSESDLSGTIRRLEWGTLGFFSKLWRSIFG